MRVTNQIVVILCLKNFVCYTNMTNFEHINVMFNKINDVALFVHADCAEFIIVPSLAILNILRVPFIFTAPFKINFGTSASISKRKMSSRKCDLMSLT